MNCKRKLVFVAITIILISVITIGYLFLPHKKVNIYDVTFRDFDGTVLKIESVKTGKTATAPTQPQRDGYIFWGWNKDFSSVTNDMVITAEYLRISDAVFKVDTITTSDENETVEIKVYIANNPGILGMVLSINYDEKNLKLIDCQNGVAFSALAFLEPSRFISGCNFVWYGSDTGNVMDGELLILTFEIADNAPSGLHPITVSWNDKDICDSNCDIIIPDIIEGGIVIVD